MWEKQKNQIPRRWSNNLAYAIGLIASDGYLHNEKKRIRFCSKDLELVKKFETALSISNKIGKNTRGGNPKRKYYYVEFTDKKFYIFLNSIGIFSKKSKTISEVDIPEKYFFDFLRGLFDGDGTFYTFWDKRWPSSFGYQISFASASKEFVSWLQKELSGKIGVRGFIRSGDGVFNLRYVKGDSRKIFAAMYLKNLYGVLFLTRKYNKIKLALEQDLNKPR